MKTKLAVMAPSIEAWREYKTPVLAVVQYVLGVNPVVVSEYERGLELELTLQRGFRLIDQLQHYFRTHFEGESVKIGLILEARSES